VFKSWINLHIPLSMKMMCKAPMLCRFHSHCVSTWAKLRWRQVLLFTSCINSYTTTTSPVLPVLWWRTN